MKTLLRRLARTKLENPRVGSIELRKYSAADLFRLSVLDQQCFPPGIAYSRAELRAFLEHPSSFTVLACEGRAILGFAIVRPVLRHAPARDRALHLLTIDVAPEARRQGVGSLLMRWILGKATELGAVVIMLEVAVDNLSARHFYERSGFTRAGIIPGYYNGKIDALRMERSVESTEPKPLAP